MSDKVNLSDFWDMLDRHDWWYMMSDDPNVYKRGQQATIRLRQIGGQSPEHKKLIDAYEAALRGGGEKPPRPK